MNPTLMRCWQALDPDVRFRLLAPRVGFAVAVAASWPQEDLEAICR